MALTRPGTYVLCKKIGQPLWPGIVYADDIAPSDIQRNRPPGYVTLVLLLNDPPQFEWATANQLSPYVSKKESNTTPPTEQHRLAWETADFIKDAGLGLEYWQDVVNNRPKNDASQDSSLGGNSNYELRGLRCGIDEEEEQLQEVLRISREACYRDPAALLTPSSSPPQRSRQSSISRNIITIDDNSDEESMNSTSLRGGLCFSPKRVRPSRQHHDTEIALSTNQKRTRDEIFEQALDAQQKKHKPSFSGLDQLLCRSSLSQRSSAPMSDAIEGDISKSKNFVRIPVGPGQEIRRFQKELVWDLPYFRDSRAGTNHFILADDGIWELRHPQLAKINTEDFQYVAEFLTTKGFGVRQPETSEQTKMAIAECASAWQTAEKLNMDDLLEHIAQKVQYLLWDNEDVLTMAIIVYRTPGPTLHAHGTMRDWISSLLAHHFWAYIKDDNIGQFFRKRMRRLKELERDVFVKRAKFLTTGAEPDEDEESEEEDLGDDGDL